MTEHPITPPRELVQQWIENTRSYDCIGAYDPEYEQCIALQAARWGADQELEACCEVLARELICDGKHVATDLRAVRRPKPPSLKQQALSELDSLENMGACNADIIRRALEALPDE